MLRASQSNELSGQQQRGSSSRALCRPNTTGEDLNVMRLKKLSAALVVAAALSAVIASSASAAATTTDVKWYTGAAPGTELTTSETFSTVIIEAWTFDTTVSSFAVSTSFVGIEVLETTLDNIGGTAIAHFRWRFTGVTVSGPAGCSAPSTITSKPLTMKADYMIGSTNYVLIEPEAGAETGFFTLELTGASCPIKTAIIPKGTVFMQSANATGTQAVEQQLNSSAAINSTAGGSLHVGTETASLTGAAKMKLSGAHAGQAFGTH